MYSIFLSIENLISGAFPMMFLVISGVYFTVKTRAVQFRKFFTSIKFSLFGNKKTERGISSFGAVCNSLAATVGTGNIAGVAAAISIGGAGAIFWMWISAMVSMCIKALEIVVALLYRKKQDGGYVGGPMHYIRHGLGRKFMPLAVAFSVAGVFSAFTTGNMTQVNSSVAVVSQNFYTRLLVGAVFAVFIAVIAKGGAQKITKFTTAVLPLMAVLYILFCLGVIIKNITLLDDALLNIVRGAFAPSAVTGGMVGSVYKTVISGAQKGIFSNEAGIGTSGMAHASAVDANVKTQGFFGVFEVFVDTLLICTLTALTILCSGVIIDYEKTASSELVSLALSTVYGKMSSGVLAIMLLLFAFSSVLGWAAYGINCADFLFGYRGKKMFLFVYPAFCVLGAVMQVSFAWRLAEFFNGVMLIINLFAVFLLSKRAVLVLKGEDDEV